MIQGCVAPLAGVGFILLTMRHPIVCVPCDDGGALCTVAGFAYYDGRYQPQRAHHEKRLAPKAFTLLRAQQERIAGELGRK